MTSMDVSSNTVQPHIAIVDHMPELGGGELAIARLAEELAPYMKMTFILARHGPFSQLLESAGRDVRIIPLGPVQGRTREQVRPLEDVWRYGPALGGAVARTSRLLREMDVDLVYTNSLKAHVYGNLSAKIAGKPCVMHIRDILAPPYIDLRLRRALGSYLMVLPPSVAIANSGATADAAPLRRRAQVIPSGIAATPARLPLPPGGPILALMGRLTSWKGQDVAIRALPRLAERFPNVRLRIAGDATLGSADYQSSLHDLARSAGVADRVEFCGFLNDPYSFFANSHIALHTSVHPEPFGQVIVEALAVGRPVVATAGGGPSEILAGGQGGILTPPGDAKALAEAIAQIFGDEERFTELADAAVLRAEDYTLAASGYRTRVLLEAVAGERRNRTSRDKWSTPR